MKKSFSKTVLKKALSDGVLILRVELIQGKDTHLISAITPASAGTSQRMLTELA